MAGLVNLRSTTRPPSAQGLTEEECGAWLQDRGPEGACGCRSASRCCFPFYFLTNPSLNNSLQTNPAEGAPCPQQL